MTSPIINPAYMTPVQGPSFIRPSVTDTSMMNYFQLKNEISRVKEEIRENAFRLNEQILEFKVNKMLGD